MLASCFAFESADIDGLLPDVFPRSCLVKSEKVEVACRGTPSFWTSVRVTWATNWTTSIARTHPLHGLSFYPRTMAAMLALKLLFAFLLPLVSALKFEIQAHPGHESASKERCIRNFVAKDQLVVVTATVSGNRGDGQTLNMHVRICHEKHVSSRDMLEHVRGISS